MTDVPEGVGQRTSRDPAELGKRLEAWLAEQLPAGADPAVTDAHGTAANGMSSETLLFTGAWTEDGVRHEEGLVGRIAPDPDDIPVFPTYDMGAQFRIMQLVGELTPVPVPRVRWLEESSGPLGAPFFVMDQVQGVVPQDNLPYTFGSVQPNWLYDATTAQRAQLQDAMVGVLADIHALPVDDPRFAFLQAKESGPTTWRRHLAHTRAWYDYCASSGIRSPLIERTFAYLEEHLPTEEVASVVSWGDSRIGNVMFDDFAPVAVLDWEMAGIGPRELDVAWMIFAHRVFEDLTNLAGMTGLPDFMARADVTAAYEQRTGATLEHLDVAFVYCALQWAIVFLRTAQRAVHFGEREMTEDPDDLIMTRAALEKLLAVTYWTDLN
ncbi:MAG TPA: phosphotransferase family protein [Mycobacteriales bacterium]|nr:phosphotransferase family protein [Mycobacteriales bacterium]